MLWNPPPQTINSHEPLLPMDLTEPGGQEEGGAHSLQSETEEVKARRSTLIEAAVILAELVKKKMRTICFCKVNIQHVFNPSMYSMSHAKSWCLRTPSSSRMHFRCKPAFHDVLHGADVCTLGSHYGRAITIYVPSTT